MPVLRSRACVGACAADPEPGGPFGAASGERVSAHLPPQSGDLTLEGEFPEACQGYILACLSFLL